MRTNRIVPVLIAIVVLASTALAQTAPPAQAQEKKPVDTAKLFAKIAGSYAYNYQTQDMVIKFWIENGKLYGAPEGQESDFAEVVLMDTEKLLFEATPQSGELFQIEFSRGESGKFEKSILRTQGIEVAGVKIK